MGTKHLELGSYLGYIAFMYDAHSKKGWRVVNTNGTVHRLLEYFEENTQAPFWWAWMLCKLSYNTCTMCQRESWPVWPSVY